jgi:hypothetical protein
MPGNTNDSLEASFARLNLFAPPARSASELTKQLIFDDEAETLRFDDDSYNRSIVEKSFRIIHFNDVYDIEGNPKEQIGGAARFATAVKLLREQGPCLVLFSGDAFSPSTRNIIKTKNP